MSSEYFDKDFFFRFLQVTKEYGCTRAERQLVIDEINNVPASKRGPMREPRDVAAEKRRREEEEKAARKAGRKYRPGQPQYSYLDLVRCGGRTSHLQAKRKKEKPKPKFRSYTEARKDRERFRRRLVRKS